jgi:hypothetical protein
MYYSRIVGMDCKMLSMSSRYTYMAGQSKDSFNDQVEVGANLLTNISEMQRKADSLHQELLELISSLSDQTTSDRESSVSSSWYKLLSVH